ncbi:phosphorylase b kinase regulatory subunit alpha, liver isoform-like isoform X3 [Pomacea canaliculata]|uniref:phosphorylase b kinase regulatory subunit alpha, liver isoform-like isoform X3 n=1 Tax=Pomacea canaliculata TaxID=400727 RepID=UPI000D72C3CD|nr:phosphorylase b kinase regulatory subunit alpha, liver isoform-like isoform X3 [Pomacea canaliculata]
MAVWGLALAYRKTADLDEDRAKAYELEKAVVMLMRGLLRSMMMQVEKLEKFKVSQNPRDALHAKYCSRTGKAVVGDYEWGHLQIDATSLYLLTLAQMTASGMEIIFTLDEVAFVQNLVFYIETAYRTPDYGIWERGDKTNHGLPELNSSSIGMAKAALEAVNELDLFGARGGPASIIYVLPDEAQQCQAILTSMLPRESSSKEVDASLITIIGFPAFAVDDTEIVAETRRVIKEKLSGRYGCCRFLRDGYKTAREDPRRLHYEPWELLMFEKIECQWPLFFAYYILDGLFRNDMKQVEEYRQRLDEIMLKSEDGIPLLPELYAVPPELVEKELANPNSQKRVAQGQLPHMWGQSMYILGRLMYEGFLSPGEIDPLNRRLVSEPKPDVVVQVVILAETRKIAEKLMQHGIEVQTIQDTSPIQVHPARVLSHIFSLLGKNRQLGVTGRPSTEIGLLATSKLYVLNDQIFAFIPEFMNQHQFYLPLDVDFLVDHFKTDTDFLARNWRMLGRPTIIFHLSRSMLDHLHNPPAALIATIKKLQSGYISGARVHMGNLSEFLNTSCICKLTFLHDPNDPSQKDQVMKIIEDIASPSCRRPYLLSTSRRSRKASTVLSGTAVSGIVRRSRSIQIDPDQLPDLYAHLNSLRRQSFVSPTASGTDILTAIHLRKKSTAKNIECPQASPYGGQSVIEEETLSRHPSLTTGIAPAHRTKRASLPAVMPSHDIYGFSRVAETIDEAEEEPTVTSQILKPVQNTKEITSYTQQFLHLKDASSGHYDLPHTPSGSPTSSPGPRHRQLKGDISDVDLSDLTDQLQKSETLQEQADIIHYLYTAKGLDWDTHMDLKKKCTVKDLLTELYEKASHWKQWWLVRHTAGMLEKRVEELAIAATDLLVRQKQLSVGMPNDGERIITCPLPPDELFSIINEACGEDKSSVSLTQELLIYLAMFIRTEPKLFHEMLRLRVGLIIQVMASEMARTLKCTGDEASDHLLNLSPFEMKTLLHHILSGKEFVINTYCLLPLVKDPSAEVDDELRLAVRSKHSKEEASEFARVSRRDKVVSQKDLPLISVASSTEESDESSHDRQGQWLRRRRLDGALNRVPVGFYPRIWEVLRRCPGIRIDDTLLPSSLTQEMTKGEFKFALQVEMALNCLPHPEYRQLMVEAMMVLVLVVENDNNTIRFNDIIQIDKIVEEANKIFIADQQMSEDVVESTLGAGDICQHLYDSAPSGRFGTMAYMCRALASILQLPVNNGALECVVS